MVKLKVFSCDDRYAGYTLEEQIAAFTAEHKITKEHIVDIVIDSRGPEASRKDVYFFYDLGLNDGKPYDGHIRTVG